MAEVVQFSAPGVVELVSCAAQPLLPGTVRVRTWYSGISAGTELTAYRGSNPYVTQRWDQTRRLFVEGEPSFAYPVAGWGYSEVGEVVETADDVVGLTAGDVVFGIWGHRSDAVVAAERLVPQRVPEGVDPVHGVFARVGAIALNAVLCAEVNLGERVAVFGQGVIGLLATRLATLSGAQVAAVDAVDTRLRLAEAMGARLLVSAGVPEGAGDRVRAWADDIGVDSAIELSGSDRALHEAVRSVVVEGKVVASGFYQGGAANLRLGEEFHHNRVQIVSSQIGGTPPGTGRRWDHARLVKVFMEQVRSGAVDVAPLLTDVVDAADTPTAFRRLDEGDPSTLQVVLRFEGAP